MPARGPWYISASAVHDLIRLRGWPDNDESFARAEDYLLALSESGAAKLKGQTEGGLLRYETGRPHGRIRLLVSTAERSEGDLPQLVQVLGRCDPAHTRRGSGR